MTTGHLTEQALIEAGVDPVTAKALVETFNRSGGNNAVEIDQAALESLVFENIYAHKERFRLLERIREMEARIAVIGPPSHRWRALERRVEQLEAQVLV